LIVSISCDNVVNAKGSYSKNKYLFYDSEKYFNPKEDFKSYFLTFDSGARLEIMQIPSVLLNPSEEQFYGFSHIAFSVSNKDNVDTLTEGLRKRNFKVVSEAHSTGDGYYESCVLDPDNNRIEITL